MFIEKCECLLNRLYQLGDWIVTIASESDCSAGLCHLPLTSWSLPPNMSSVETPGCPDMGQVVYNNFKGFPSLQQIWISWGSRTVHWKSIKVLNLFSYRAVLEPRGSPPVCPTFPQAGVFSAAQLPDWAPVCGSKLCMSRTQLRCVCIACPGIHSQDKQLCVCQTAVNITSNNTWLFTKTYFIQMSLAFT